MSKKRVLIFIVAYNAEKTIESVLTRIPASLAEHYEVEILVIDDASKDQTFERGEIMSRAGKLPFPLHVLFNPVNQGYGGNQKIGFHYAIEKGFDIVALVHGDGQYAPECLPELIEPLAKNEADAVFGSRMITRDGARKGGMPLYKFVGNKVLTTYQNIMLKSSLSEFHSGYRLYSVPALASVPFDNNSNVFHFDTEIIIQLLFAGKHIKELPIPTYYGDEICHVNGMKYAWDVCVATLKARMQQMGLFYDRKYDCRPKAAVNAHYLPKLGYDSPHSRVVDLIPAGSKVLDLGCAGGYLGVALEAKGCKVTGLDMGPLADGVSITAFAQHDLNTPLPVDVGSFDYIIMMDVIEHLASPEQFVEQLLEKLAGNRTTTLVVSTGNVAFLPVRLMLLFGQFNYGKRGILDMTHTRLFTFKTLTQLFTQYNFDVVSRAGVPAPFPLAVGDNALARGLLALNNIAIRISKTLFAYQMFYVIRPKATLKSLLKDAVESSIARADNIDKNAA